MNCQIMRKLVYPIAKKKVIGVTRMSDDTYEKAVEMINAGNMPEYDLTLWTLTLDDYIIALNRNTNTLISVNKDSDNFLFSCY